MLAQWLPRCFPRQAMRIAMLGQQLRQCRASTRHLCLQSRHQQQQPRPSQTGARCQLPQQLQHSSSKQRQKRSWHHRHRNRSEEPTQELACSSSTQPWARSLWRWIRVPQRELPLEDHAHRRRHPQHPRPRPRVTQQRRSSTQTLAVHVPPLPLLSRTPRCRSRRPAASSLPPWQCSLPQTPLPQTPRPPWLLPCTLHTRRQRPRGTRRR
mmetsp:Transcript_45382/g.106568  ORF Transcript_45382/g.106568 Transcript_45382/m.106568 type:complete len:210 (+) Transcript_45382:1125-1754(+)